MSDERLARLYAEALRRLASQEGDLNQLRTRSGSLISACAISTSFLGANLLRQKQIGVAAALAIAFFVLSVSLFTWVLAGSVRGWVGGYSPRLVRNEWLDKNPDLDLGEMEYSLSLFIERGVESNEVLLRSRRRVLLLGGVFLTMEIAFWIWDLRN